jgi:hypothetical protein
MLLILRLPRMCEGRNSLESNWEVWSARSGLRDCSGEQLVSICVGGMKDVNKLYQTTPGDHRDTPSSTMDGNGWAHETSRWMNGFIIAAKESLPIENVGVMPDLRHSSQSDILRLSRGQHWWLQCCRRDREEHDSSSDKAAEQTSILSIWRLP